MTSQCVHRHIRSMIKQFVWVGITDLKTEGVWRFVTNDAIFDPNQRNLFQWGEGEPNNSGGDQHCGKIWNFNLKLDDDGCLKKYLGLCEIETNKATKGLEMYLFRCFKKHLIFWFTYFLML